MRLFLIQHAEAAEPGPDGERHLTASGIRDVEVMGSFLERGTPGVLTIVHSGKVRARETAERLTRHIGPDAVVEEATGLAPKDPVEPWLDRINSHNTDLAIIGHMPFLSKLASRLLIGEENPEILVFEQCAVACLERDDQEQWRLIWMVPPHLVVR